MELPVEANAGGMSPVDAVDLQDELLTVCNDLDRLQGLLSSATAELSQAFHSASALVLQARQPTAALSTQDLTVPLAATLARAITALQFDDMASQLIAHTRRVLRSRADRLALEAFGDDGDEAVLEIAPRRGNPVTQDEMDAGAVELF